MFGRRPLDVMLPGMRVRHRSPFVWIEAVLVFAVLSAACSPEAPPTYAEHVGPILHRNCAACHRPDGPAPMALLSYEDARAMAQRIAYVAGERLMPPWQPARDAGIRFQNERILTEREIRVLRQWSDAGAPPGDLAHAPEPPPATGGWTLGTPDLVLSMDEPFTVPAAGGHDLFRNFVLDVPLDEPRWVRAVELLPDNPRVVHHAVMKVDPTNTSRLAAQADPRPGFDALVAESAARPPGGFFAGWTPGLVAVPSPEGMAWRLEPGMDFVVNAHLWPADRPEDVSLRVGLHFADDEPTRVPVLLRLGVQTIHIPAGDSAYVVEDSFRIPVDIQALGAYPHAHFLAREVSAWGETPDGRRIPLMEIPAWDFNRQEAYYYAEPLDLPAGTTLRIRYRYDNSAANTANPHDPPRTVLWGLESDDEMAEFWLQVVTQGEPDREALTRVAEQRDLEKQIEGWQHLAALDPENPDVQVGLAEVAHARGRLDEALHRYGLALAARPGMTHAHYGRGRVLEDMDDVDAAMAAYRDALEALPSNLGALNDLGRLHLTRGDSRQARELLERAVALDSSFADALNNLGSILIEERDFHAAAARLQRAVRLRPDFPEAHFNLALALVSTGRTQEGLRVLSRGVELDGSQLQPAVSVAWILATDPAEAVRDPRAAADLALQMRAVTGPDPVVSDVAAAAFAALGNYADAVRLIDEAIAAAEERGADALLPDLRARRARYLAGEPYVREAAH